MTEAPEEQEVETKRVKRDGMQNFVEERLPQNRPYIRTVKRLSPHWFRVNYQDPHNGYVKTSAIYEVIHTATGLDLMQRDAKRISCRIG